VFSQYFAVENVMNRNSYSEFTGDSQVSSQVADWAKNWAETFRREAWQQPTLEAAGEAFASDLLDETKDPRTSPAA